MEKLLRTLITEIRQLADENKKIKGELASSKAEIIKAVLQHSASLAKLEAEVRKLKAVR